MEKPKTIEEVLSENGLAFSPNMEDHYMTELEGIWNDACAESGGEVTDAQVDEYLDVLKKMGLVIPVHKEELDREKKKYQTMDPEILKLRHATAEARRRDAEAERAELEKKGGPNPEQVFRIFPPQNEKDMKHKVFLILQAPDGGEVPHHIAGGFTNPERSLAFEYYDGGPKFHMSSLNMDSADIRFRKMFSWLGLHHISVRLSGNQDGDLFYVYRIKAVAPPQDGGGLTTIEDNFLQYMIERLRTSILQAAEEEVPDQMAMSDLPDIINFMDCCADTLPANIRQWARKNIITAGQEGGNPDEKRHAKRALSMMLNIRWKSSYFDPIDPVGARRILDEELYGLEKVKQRVIETIIQINRTHTLPGYGLLLIGPPGTGKSQIAYAVGRILKLPCTVLDMSTIRDPEALTGSSRIYSNARPGRIMEAFSRAGSSNIVFVINELDKADATKDTGSSGDVLLTLLDHLGFTDVYMECAIPTGGVYPIATANDKSRISGPLLSRFSVIEIPDYTPEEKRTIFWNYSLPRVLLRMGMKPGEVVLTDDAVDFIIDRFSDYTGCRELEQAAEHLAGNALFRIETDGVSSVTYRAEDAKLLFGDRQKTTQA